MDADVKFLGTYYALAKQVEAETGVPALSMLAQHILEGGRENKNRFFNFFGVKTTPDWKGGRQLQRTWEWHKDNKQAKQYGTNFVSMEPYQGGFKYIVNQSFRAYGSPVEAYQDHAAFLRRNPRYAAAFKTKDPAEFCRRIAAAGYATDNQYAAKLTALVAQLGKKLLLALSTKPDAPASPPPVPPVAVAAS